MMKRMLALTMLCLSMSFMGADKVLSIGLGDGIYIGDDHAMIERYIRSLKGRGIDADWSGPEAWRSGCWEDFENLEFVRWTNGLLRENGIKVILNIAPNSFYGSKVRDEEFMHGQTLNPETGLREAKYHSLDMASAEAMNEFLRRLQQYIYSTGPYEGFIIDEVVLIAFGENWDERTQCMYWTSPTYSDAALASFRRFVQEKNLLPDAQSIRFPVTTVFKERGDKYDADLPAVPLTEENSAYLQADNDYPNSPLWQAWFDWRVQLLTDYHQKQFSLVRKILDKTPGWLGCFSSAPNLWYTRESGLDKERIAALPELDWLVSGYCSGMRLETLKDAADKNNKKLGGMIELSRYGIPEARKNLKDELQFQVEKGARCFLFYPLANLNPERNEQGFKDDGRAYNPEAVKNWEECVQFLRETGRSWSEQ